MSEKIPMPLRLGNAAGKSAANPPVRQSDGPQSETGVKAEGPLQPNPGIRFGRLVVIQRQMKKGTHWYFLCRCDCGNETSVRADHLRTRKIRSCGCLHREAAAQW